MLTQEQWPTSEVKDKIGLKVHPIMTDIEDLRLRPTVVAEKLEAGNGNICVCQAGSGNLQLEDGQCQVG